MKTAADKGADDVFGKVIAVFPTPLVKTAKTWESLGGSLDGLNDKITLVEASQKKVGR